MIPKDYQCDGQLNIWDYASSVKENPKPYEYEFNRSVGQKVKVWLDDEVFIGKITDFDHYYTFCEVNGEELVLTNKDIAPLEELPSLIEVVELVSRKFGLEFTEHKVDYLGPNSINNTVYRHTFNKHSVLEIDESNYLGEDRRHIGVDWEGKNQMTGCPCDTIEEVIKAVQRVIERSERQSNVSKRRNR